MNPIDELQEFLECDLYSKFRPIEKIKGKEWCREDCFKNEKEFVEYMRLHFNAMKKRLNSQKEHKTKGEEKNNG